MASAKEIQETLELLSSDLETVNKEQQEQIRDFQRMNATKVTNESKLKTLAEIVQHYTGV